GRAHSVEPLGFASSRQGEVIPLTRRHVLEGSTVLPPSREIKGRNRLAIPSPAFLDRVGRQDRHHPFGILNARAPQHQTVHLTEDGCIRCDSKRQSHDGHGCEARVLEQHPCSKPRICQKIFKRRPAPHLAAGFFNQRYVSELSPRHVRGFFSRHPVSNQLLDLLFNVFTDLFGELSIELTAREQLPKPVHTSPAVNQRVRLALSVRSQTLENPHLRRAKNPRNPFNIFSKRDHLSSRMFSAFAVNL